MPRNRSLEQYWKEHLSLYIFIGVIFVTGVIFGAVMVSALSLEQKQEMTRYLSNFFSIVNQGELNGDATASFRDTLALHMKWVLIIWLLGMSVIGLPFILILDFLKGVLVGFTVGYMAGTLSWKGLLFALVSVVPQNLIVIPVILVCSATAVSFSIHLVKNRFIQKRGELLEPLIRFSGVTLASGVLLVGVALFEAHLSPVMMKWVTPMLITLGAA
ncbi:stage II sporulation protein M [Paenibacillus puerhi]|uniref:stage II sporulation protein M n=1 Tax=Paenibacillus puerhi TaxID=2692622 RepID=UPI001358CB2F|nr:stage II sporulation protein M [Paenibacillus puerhi]